MTPTEIKPGETVMFDDECACGDPAHPFIAVYRRPTFGKDTIESIKEKQRQEEAEQIYI